MKVVLLRHATRSLTIEGDVGLNQQGQAQAAQFADTVTARGLLPAPTAIFSSPKKRARQTLLPLSLVSGIALSEDPRLDERHHGETLKDFEARLSDWVRDIAAIAKSADRAQAVYACSHLDWLEAILPLLPSTMSEIEAAGSWPNASFRIFRIQDGLWTLSGEGLASARD